jgi:hypothetical protein
MYVKDLFCSTCIVLTQLCKEGHVGKNNARTTKEVFNVHDA